MHADDERIGLMQDQERIGLMQALGLGVGTTTAANVARRMLIRRPARSLPITGADILMTLAGIPAGLALKAADVDRARRMSMEREAAS